MKELLRKKTVKFGLLIIVLLVAAVIIGINAQSAQRQKEYDNHIKAAEKYLTELDYEQAIAEYTLAYEIEPNEEVLDALEQTYLAYAKSYVDAGDYERAISILEEGYAQIGRESLRERIEELRAEMERSPAELVLQLSNPEYDSFIRASNGIILARKNGLIGAINLENEIVVPFEYDAWRSMDDNGNLVLLKSSDDGLWTYFILDANGNMIQESTYDTIVSNGVYIQNCYEGDYGYGGDRSDSSIDYYNMDGTLLVSLPYDDDLTFEEMEAITRENEEYVEWALDVVFEIHGFYDGISLTDIMDGNIGLVNDAGNIQWSGVQEWASTHTHVDITDDGPFRAVEYSGTPYTPLNSLNHEYFLSDRGYNEWGADMALMDKNYEIVAEFNLYLVQADEESGFIPEFANREDFKEGNNYRGYYHDGDVYYNYGTNMVWILGGKDVLVDFSLYPNMTVDTMDNSIVKAVYDTIYMSNADYWLVQDGEQWGYIDHDGNELAMFDDATDFYGQYAVVVEDGIAYTMNGEFEKVRELGEADSVYLLGDLFGVGSEGTTYFYRF